MMESEPVKQAIWGAAPGLRDLSKTDALALVNEAKKRVGYPVPADLTAYNQAVYNEIVVLLADRQAA